MNHTFLRTIAVVSVLSVIFISKTNSSGPGAGYTNAPSESNCATSGCHTGNFVTSGSNWNRITLQMSMSGNGYIPDSTYEFLLHDKETGLNAAGFQITCLTESTGKSAGTFSTVDSRTQTMSRTYGSDSRSYLGHTSSAKSATDSASYRIKWKAPSSNVGNVRFYVVYNKANGNGNESGDVIYAKTWSVAPSTLLPSAKVKIVDSLYCSNVDLTFAATTTGNPTSYRWEFLDIGVNPIVKTDTAPKQTFTSTKKYRVVLTVKNNYGTSPSDTFSFTTIQGASLSFISPAGTSEVCSGDSFSLSCTKPAGHTIQWSHGPTAQNIKIADSGIYTVTTISSNKCRRVSSPKIIKVLDLPSLLILKSFSGDTICANEPFSMGALVTKGTVDSFSYSSKSGPFMKDDSLPQNLSSGPVNYSVWGKNAKGCVSKPSNATVQVKSKITGPALSGSNIDFTSFRVNWAAISGATSYRVSIDSGKTFITPSSGNNGLFHDITGLLGNHTMKILVYATMNDLCSKSLTSEISLTTLSCTPLVFDIQAMQSKACKNGSVTVQLHQLAGKTFGILVDGKYVGTDTVQNIVVNRSGSYDISVIDSSALICGYTTKSVLLNIDSASAPIFTPNSINTCSNSAVPFTVSVAADPKIDSVFYYKNGNLESSGKSLNHTYSLNNKDSIWAISKNGSGCLSNSSNRIVATINPVPSASFSISNIHFDFTFTANDTLGNHKWKVGNDSIEATTAQFDLTGFKNDTATVTHTITRNGCSASETQKIFVPDFASTKVNKIPGARIFPNPAVELLNVYLPVVKNNATIELFNATGQLILAANLKSGYNQVITDRLPQGVYQFRLSVDKKETSGSVIIERQ